MEWRRRLGDPLAGPAGELPSDRQSSCSTALLVKTPQRRGLLLGFPRGAMIPVIDRIDSWWRGSVRRRGRARRHLRGPHQRISGSPSAMPASASPKTNSAFQRAEGVLHAAETFVGARRGGGIRLCGRQAWPCGAVPTPRHGISPWAEGPRQRHRDGCVAFEHLDRYRAAVGGGRQADDNPAGRSPRWSRLSPHCAISQQRPRR